MTNNLHCATCGRMLKLEDQTVSCPKCDHSGTLAAAILVISAQADDAGRALDVQSIRAGARGRLEFDFLPDHIRRVTNRAESA